MKSKITTIILVIIIVAIIITGIAFAYITWSGEKINSTGNSECFDVFYVKGTDIGSDQSLAELMPSSDYTGGLSSTVKMGINSKCTEITAEGIIKLNTLNTTSSNLFRKGLLNYTVLKNNTKIAEGNITSVGTININVGILNKFSYSSNADSYKVYVWVDNNLVTNDDAFLSYYGNISTNIEQRD